MACNSASGTRPVVDPDPSANTPAREREARAKWNQLWRLLLAEQEPAPPTDHDEVELSSGEKRRAAALDAHPRQVSIAATLGGPCHGNDAAGDPKPKAGAVRKGRAANG
jgi:hypothetical protein